MKPFFFLFTVSLLLGLPGTAICQQNIAALKHKPCLLKGKWRLVESALNGKQHEIKKEEYDAVMRFRSFHRYSEEVKYEGYHWIIEGKWDITKGTATLVLSERKYKLGQLDDKPTDITYQLSAISKKEWKGNSIAKGQQVQVTYRR